MKLRMLNGWVWGVMSAVLGFSVLNSWQAWVIILCGVTCWSIAEGIGKREA